MKKKNIEDFRVNKLLRQTALQTGNPRGTYKRNEPHPFIEGLFYYGWITGAERWQDSESVQKMNERTSRWNKSDKGKEAIRKHKQSEKGKAATKAYQQTDRFKAYQDAYKKSGKSAEAKAFIARNRKLSLDEIYRLRDFENIVIDAIKFYRQSRICSPICSESPQVA